MRLPNKWSEVTLKQYQEVIEVSLIDMDEIDKHIKIISILTEQPEDKIADLPLPAIKSCIKWINFIYQTPIQTKAKQKVKIGNRKYKVNLEVNKLSGGEYIDLTTYTKDKETINANLHFIISIFLHEVNIFGRIKKSNYTTNAKGEFCQKLECRNEIAEYIKDKITMDLVFNLSGFFLKLYESLMAVTLDYSIMEVNKMNSNIAKELGL